MRTGCGSGRGGRASGSGSIRDIACFEPGGAPDRRRQSRRRGHDADAEPPEPVTMRSPRCGCATSTPPRPAESAYLRGLAEGRLIGQRCPACGKVYIPSRGVCPADGVPADRRGRTARHRHRDHVLAS